MKTLITGGAGFIGYHLAKKLHEAGHEIVLVDNFSRGVKDSCIQELEKQEGVTLFSADLMEPDALKNLSTDFDYIYHLAAIIGVKNVLKRPYAVLHDNVELLFRLMQFAEEQEHLKRFIFASTSEIYAGTLQFYGLTFPTPEDTPLTITPLDHPRTSYMLSKIYGEALLNQSSLPYTIIRPHNFFGPRMGLVHVIPELSKKTYYSEKNGKIDVPSVEHKRTFCYIDDGIEMIVRLAVSEGSLHNAFNIGKEMPEVTVMEVAEKVIKTVGRSDVTINPLPPTPGSPERRCPDMKKTFDCIGYRAEISLEDGIGQTFEWYKKMVFDGGETSAE